MDEAIEKLSKLAENGSRLRQGGGELQPRLRAFVEERLRAMRPRHSRRRIALKALPQQQHRAAAVQPGPALHRRRPARGRHQDAAGLHRQRLHAAAGRSAHLPRQCADREEALQGSRAADRPGAVESQGAQPDLARDEARGELRAQGFQGLRGVAGAADRARADQARLLEAAVHHVLRDEGGHRGGGGARAWPNARASSTSPTRARISTTST